MQPTPSPRSINDAPEFFLTMAPDFLATDTDQTPAGTTTGKYRFAAMSQNPRPEGTSRLSSYQDLLPEASRPSTFAPISRPSFFMRATVASTPAASQTSNGPSSQLNPRRIA